MWACCSSYFARWRFRGTLRKDTALMAIDEINAKGGVKGKKPEAVVVDPGSAWPRFAEKPRQFVSKDKVVWSAAGRQSAAGRCCWSLRNSTACCSTRAVRG
jgi:Periplasmic binding protein domain